MTGEPSTADVIARTLVDLPDVAVALAAADAAAWATVDASILELCRLRIAQLLDHGPELAVRTPGSGVSEDAIAALRTWPTSPRFGPVERACLELCEQSVIDVAGVSPAQTAAVAEALGTQGLADFVSALLVVEQRQRLRLTWSRLRTVGASDGS